MAGSVTSARAAAPGLGEVAAAVRYSTAVDSGSAGAVGRVVESKEREGADGAMAFG